MAESGLSGSYGELPTQILWGSVKHGHVFIPMSDSAKLGWGKPYKSADGVLINPPLGTVNGTAPYNLLESLRDPAGAFLSYRLTRSFTLPHSTGVSSSVDEPEYGNLDWVWRNPDGSIKGYVSWDGAWGRSAHTELVPAEWPVQFGDQPFRTDDPERGDTGTNTRYFRVGSLTLPPYLVTRKGFRVYCHGKVVFSTDMAFSYVQGAAIRTQPDGTQWLLVVMQTGGIGPDTDDITFKVYKAPLVKMKAAALVYLGEVTLPDNGAYPASPSHSFFFNASATRCSSVYMINGDSGDNLITTHVDVSADLSSITVSHEIAERLHGPYSYHWETHAGSTTASSSGYGSSTWSGGPYTVAIDYVGDTEVRATVTLEGGYSDSGSSSADFTSTPWTVSGSGTKSGGSVTRINIAGDVLDVYSDTETATYVPGYSAEDGAYYSTTEFSTTGLERYFIYLDLRYKTYVYFQKEEAGSLASFSRTLSLHFNSLELQSSTTDSAVDRQMVPVTSWADSPLYTGAILLYDGTSDQQTIDDPARTLVADQLFGITSPVMPSIATNAYGETVACILFTPQTDVEPFGTMFGPPGITPYQVFTYMTHGSTVTIPGDHAMLNRVGVI